MQITKLFKGAMVVLPLFIATACTSTSQTKNTSSDVNVSDSQKIQQLQSVNAIYFDLDQYNIKPEFAHSLDSHAEFLRSHPSFSIVIEGHADERGTPEYNIALGERRASAVKAYLQGHGVTESQMSIVSYGKEKPAVLGHDELAYAKNRRAVIVY